MSVRKRELTVRLQAQADIRSILNYTRGQWGVEQRRRYGIQIRQAMRSLLDHPERGRSRDHLYLGCRSLLVERHVIFYRVTDDEIIVGRVLHVNQDPTDKVTP